MTEQAPDLGSAVARLREASERLCAGTSGLPLPIGELAPVVAGAVLALSREDWWVPSMRERAGAVLRDVPVERIAEGLRGARPYRVAPSSSSPALRALLGVGLAVAHRDSFVLVHLGVGSVSDGAVHEALNLASLQRPNVLFLVSLHPLDDRDEAHGGRSPLPRQIAGDIVAVARAHGIGASSVDGTDASAVHRAVAAIRSAKGPHLLAARLAPGRAKAQETST